MRQQLKTNWLIVFLLGTLCLSQFVGTIHAQKFFDVFSSDRTVNSPTPGDDAAKAVANQTDGKIVVAGQSYDAGKYKFSLVRYNTDGSLDTTFGAGGKVLTAISAMGSGATAVAVLSNGKILAAGYNKVSGLNNDVALIRYNSNGTLDTTFGSGGIVTTEFSTQSGDTYDEKIYAMAIQSDGKIVVGGTSFFGIGSTTSLMVRYNADGSLDTSFGSSGRIYGVFGSSINGEIVTSIAMQGSKIVIGGSGGDYRAASFPLYPMLVRLNSSGSPDTSFGSIGARVIDNSQGYVNSLGFMAVYAGEDKIVMTGYINASGGKRLTLWSVNLADGTPDTTFGTGGKVMTNHADSSGAALKVQLKNGLSNSIVVAGNSANIFLVARFTLDGRLDTTFNNSGISSFYNVSPGNSGSLLIQPFDNKIVTVGSGNGDFQTFRYKNNGTLDTTFDGDGIRTDNIGIN